jgi:hypothetical protein
MTKRARFTQADVTRAVRACQEAGLEIASITIHPDGAIEVTPVGSPEQERLNPLDRLLNSWDEERG